MLLSLLFYGYATGTFSSRALETATYDSVAVRFVAGNQHPDHDTICTFRRRFLPAIEGLFLQILQVAVEMGVLTVGDVALDGTKIKANASKHKALSYRYAQKLEAQLTAEVEELIAAAEQADAEDLPDTLSIPDEIARREDRLQTIQRVKQVIEERAQERFEEEQADYEERLRQRREEEEQTGRKKPGPKPTPPTATGPGPKDQVNLTDEGSRIMHTSANGFQQAYNAQATVCMDTHLILGGHVSQKSNDKQELAPALEALEALDEREGLEPEDTEDRPPGRPGRLAADSGYYSTNNITACENRRIVPYISKGRQTHNQRWTERFAPRTRLLPRGKPRPGRRR
jgi:predicted house-cleaning noncanonical NTP pyrophosphatase (MazG superfamily)